MSNTPLSSVRQALENAVTKKRDAEFEARRNELMKSMGNDLVSSLRPSFEKLTENAAKEREAMAGAVGDSVRSALKDIKFPEQKEAVVHVSVPDVIVPEITVPTPKVTVNVPEIRVPEVRWPEKTLPIEGWVQLMGVDLQNPLPVQLRDATGKPVNLLENLTSIVASGGGGFARQVKINNTSGEPIPVSGTFSAPATTYVIPGNSEGIVYNTDNPLPITGALSLSAAVGQGDEATALRVVHAGNAASSVYVLGGGSNAVIKDDSAYTDTVTSGVQSVALRLYNGTNYVRSRAGEGDFAGALRVVHANDATASVWVNGFSASVAASIIGSDGLAFGTSKPVPVTMVTGVSASVNVSITDSSGIGYSGTNPVPITWVSGAGASQVVHVSDSTGVAYSGSNPLPVLLSGAVGSSSANLVYTRQTNPTAVQADYVPAAADDIGRQLVRPIQVRDLIHTAYVAVSTGTEATLHAAVAGKYYDLIKIVLSNNSTAAVGVDVRCTAAGNIVQHYEVPANGTAGESLSVPWPQDATGNDWTVDLPDITGTTVYVSALFTEEV